MSQRRSRTALSAGSSLARIVSAARRALTARALTRRVLAVGGLPAVLAFGVPLPMLSHQFSAPSRLLCQGWSSCDNAGYSSHGYAAHFSTMYWRMYPGSECTNYTAFVESTVFHVRTPGYLLGNGGQWALNARLHGMVVNNTPSVGAVAEWNGGSFGIGMAGHVAVVEQVGPGGSYIVISQQNMGAVTNKYDWTMIQRGFPVTAWQEWPSNFIHFRMHQRPGPGFRGGTGSHPGSR